MSHLWHVGYHFSTFWEVWNLLALTFYVFVRISVLCRHVVVVAGRQDQSTATLTCNTETDSGITWRFHGDVIEEVTLDDSTQQSGPNLTISDVDVPVLGQYSCWRGQEMLSSVYLLLEAEEGEKLKSHFSHSPMTQALYISRITTNWNISYTRMWEKLIQHWIILWYKYFILCDTFSQCLLWKVKQLF